MLIFVNNIVINLNNIASLKIEYEYTEKKYVIVAYPIDARQNYINICKFSTKQAAQEVLQDIVNRYGRGHNIYEIREQEQ